MIFRNSHVHLFGFWVLLCGCLLFLGCRPNPNAANENEPADTTNLEEAEFGNIPQIKQLSERIAADSSNAGLYFLRGNTYLQANSPKLASADFYRALELDSTNSTYYLAAANVFFETKNVLTAIKLLEKAQTVLPDSLSISTELGKYYYYVQDYDKSFAKLNKVVATQPQNAEAYFWLAMNYRDKNKPDEAINNLKKATQADTTFYNAYLIMANLLAQTNNPMALANYNKAIALDTASIEARYGKAMFLQNTGKTAEALEEYRQIVLIDPQNADTHYNVGYIYFNNKDYQTALKSFNIAVRVAPTFAKAYYMRGLCAEKLGKKTDARTDYESALKFDPQLTLAKEALSRVQ